MALVTRKGVLTASTSNGATANTDLSAVFSAGEPIRAIIFWCTVETAAGSTADDAIFSMGWATNDGGSIQQGYISYFDNDASGTGDLSRGLNTTAVIKLFSDGTPTVDAEIDVTTFNDDDFTVTYTNAPTAAIKIHYFAIGGSDVTAARAFQFDLAASSATQDVTVNTGFGQPDLLFLLGRGSSTTLGDSTGNAAVCLGIGTDDTDARSSEMFQQDGNNNMVGGAVQEAGILSSTGTPGGVVTIQAQADLSARAAWPTDGFELSYSTQAVSTYNWLGLALKGDFTATIGADVALTAGSTDDLAHDVTPTGAIFWGWALAAAAGLRTSDADQNSYFVGASDMTNEGVAGFGQDEGVGTSTTGRWHSESKAVQFYVQAASPSLNSEADAAVNGTNVRLTWTDLDTVARQYNYVILGSQAGATTHNGSASLAITVDAATNGTRTTFSTVALPVTLTVATAGRRGTTGAAALPITFDAAVNGVRTTSGSASLPITLDIFTAGSTTNGGTATLGLTLAIATAGSVVKRGRVDLPITVGIAATGTKSTTGSAALPITFSTTSTAIVGAFSSASLPILFDAFVAGDQPGAAPLPEIGAGTIAESGAGSIGRGGYGRIAPPTTGGI